MRQTTNHKSDTATLAARHQSARLIADMQAFMAADFDTEIPKAVARQMRVQSAIANRNRSVNQNHRPAKHAA